MNILQITKCDQLNGPGLRVVLWVAGCSHHCDECQNSFSWDPNQGIPFSDEIKQEIFAELEKDWCSGLTFTGGDPLFIGNRQEVIEFAKEVRDRFPNKTQWLWTGFTWNDIVSDSSMIDILKYVDVICDGRYEKTLRDVDLPWVGSSNQHVIDVKKRIELISKISNNQL